MSKGNGSKRKFITEEVCITETRLRKRRKLSDKDSQSPSFNKASSRRKNQRSAIASDPLSEFMPVGCFPAENYLASPLDKKNLVSVKRVDLLDSINGLGLFARKDIPADECIGVYTGVENTPKGYKKRQGKNPDRSYLMTYTSGRFVDALRKGNFTRYINFSDTQANVQFVEDVIDDKLVMKVITLKDIRAGQQFLVDYNVYDEKYSEHYYFLNPEDGWLSSSDWLNAHAKKYSSCYVKNNLAIFGLNVDEEVYATQVGRAIFEENNLAEMAELNELNKMEVGEINFPYLKIGSSNCPIEFNKMDAFTPLMLACYLGQFDNVRWLVKNGANINQQQNLSGNCSLFLALEGYRQASHPGRQDQYVQSILFLIEQNANLFVHDRDEKTFMHRALQCLSEAHFQEVLTKIKAVRNRGDDVLFNYTDKNDDDIFLSCIREGRYRYAQIIMDVYPSYFKTHFMNYKDRDITDYHRFLFHGIVKDQPEEVKADIRRCLIKQKSPKLKLLLTDLGLFSKNVRIHKGQLVQENPVIRINNSYNSEDSDMDTEKSSDEFASKIWTLDL